MVNGLEKTLTIPTYSGYSGQLQAKSEHSLACHAQFLLDAS